MRISFSWRQCAILWLRKLNDDAFIIASVWFLITVNQTTLKPWERSDTFKMSLYEFTFFRELRWRYCQHIRNWLAIDIRFFVKKVIWFFTAQIKLHPLFRHVFWYMNWKNIKLVLDDYNQNYDTISFHSYNTIFPFQLWALHTYRAFWIQRPFDFNILVT